MGSNLKPAFFRLSFGCCFSSAHNVDDPSKAKLSKTFLSGLGILTLKDASIKACRRNFPARTEFIHKRVYHNSAKERKQLRL